MKKNLSQARRRPNRHLGVTLIELMISIALGLSVVLVILSFYQSLSGGGKSSRASQVMTENAESAFQLLAQQFRQTGFNPRRPTAGFPTSNPLKIGTGAPGMGLFACANGFSNGSGSGPADNIQSLTCNGTSTTTITYALAVQFEADAFSPSLSGGIPADCRGFAVPAQSVGVTSPTGTVTYYVVENRYFVANGGLSCSGNGGTTATFDTPSQPLVENIESMSLSFGTTAPNVTGALADFVAGYLTGDQLGPASGVGSGVQTDLAALTPIQRWGLVKIVRVCLVVKADRRTLFEPEGGTGTVFGKYYGCDLSSLIDITDGFERRAYIRHFALRNRIS
jgi:type IV pilus assembly protein PilW